MSGHSKFNPTFAPVKVYPARTAAQKKLVADVRAAISHGCQAVLEQVQKFIDCQQAEQQHQAAVRYLADIFTNLCARCAKSSEDCEGYVEALIAMVNRPNYVELNINDPRDYLPSSYRAIHSVDAASQVVASHPKRLTDLILRFAKSSAEVASLWVGFVDHMLDELLGGDFFGTEGQLDPRGDRRDDA